MLLSTYTEALYWMLLAIGGALFLGTGTALLRYRRTGLFPGQQPVDDAATAAPTRIRGAVTRCAVGAVLLLGGVGGLLAVNLG